MSSCTFDYSRIFTDFHARWAMEFLGHAFSLPMSSKATISKAIKVYSEWLGLGSNRPKCVEENEAWYQREII